MNKGPQTAVFMVVAIVNICKWGSICRKRGMNMRYIGLTLILLLLLLAPFELFAFEPGFARLSLIEGDVQVRIADSDDWVPASANTPLYEGDSVWSPKGGRTEIQLRDGSVIRLGSRSALNVLKVDSDFLQLNLTMGRAYVRTGAKRQWDLQIDLAESTVRIDDKGKYRLDVSSNGDEDISVYRGSAYVESYGSRTRVKTGEMLSLESSGSEIYPVNPQDAWDRWNNERDARQAARSAAERRLPDELVVYEDELGGSGEWVVTREYGHVWRPVVVAPDWAPYREGRWIWRAGEYVWVSYEPWGWAPYHYGRWAVVAGFGWCWVPPSAGDVYWSPGYVGWISTPTHVGWVPLAPGEVYYGRGYYGRHSVNVTNVTNITVINKTNVYRNSRHSHALTAVERESFVSGRGRYSRRSFDTFSREKVVAGRPEPRRGVREILMPRVKTVSRDNLPPARIAKQPVGELRRKYPRLEREGEARQQRGGSVGTPQGQVRQGREELPPAARPGDKGGKDDRPKTTPPRLLPTGAGEAQQQRPETQDHVEEQRQGGRGERGVKGDRPVRENRPAGVAVPPGAASQGQPRDGVKAGTPPRPVDRPDGTKQADEKRRDRGEQQTRPEEARKGGTVKEGAVPERKAREVWKIRQKDEPARAKDKEKDKDKGKDKDKKEDKKERQ